MDQKEINALISLLDDPDEETYNHIRERLLSLGQDVIPALEDAWEHSFDTLIQNRIENIIQKIQFSKVADGLRNWAHYHSNDLLAGVLLVARYQYPDLDEPKLRKHIEQIKQDVWLELNQNLTALEKVRVINHILFDVHNFSGNTTNYHAPQNSYINNVLESKKGNPLSLSILYCIIAQDLEIPIFGVNLPEHFVLAYKDEDNIMKTVMGEGAPNDVLFYINPFSKGAIFGRKEIDAFLKQLKVTPRDLFYEPCSNLDMVRRLITNLVNSYEKLGYPHKIEELRLLMNSLG